MKKTTLILNKETIRRLGVKSLRGVRGGSGPNSDGDTSCVPWDCITEEGCYTDVVCPSQLGGPCESDNQTCWCVPP